MKQAMPILLMALVAIPAFAKKDKSKDYQMGTYVTTEAVADGTITSALHGDGTTIAGDVHANHVGVYVIKVADGTWTVETYSQATDSKMRSWGQTPVHFKSEKANPLDSLKGGDRVLFRVERHKKLLATETHIYIPFAENPDKETDFLGTFIPDTPPPQAQKPTDNVKAMCDAHKLSPELEKQYCTPQAPASQVDTPTPAPAPIPAPAVPVARPPVATPPQTTDPRLQDPKLALFKKMCDSGTFTKGVYANSPIFQQQCDQMFPKEPAATK